MAGKADKKARKSKDVGGDIISDERFAAAQTDPRFHRFPKAKNKVEIDKRFAGMFKDKAFQVKSTVDKRGRKLRNNRGKEDMRKYYRLQNEEEDWDRDQEKAKQSELPVKQLPVKKDKKQKLAPVISEDDESASDSEGDEELDAEERQRKERWARARGLTGPSTSSSDEDGSASDDSDEDISDDEKASDEEEINVEEWGVGRWAANPDEKIPEIADATRRLAVVDLDWSKVRASDIFVMLQSFLRKGQKIEKVTVYPSDYGLERMADEARFGPRGLTSGPLASALNGDGSKVQANGHTKAKQRGDKQYKMDPAERAAILEVLNEQDSDAADDSAAEDKDAESTYNEASDSEDLSEPEGDELNSEEEEEQTRVRGRRDDDSGSKKSKPDQKTRRLLQLYEQSRLRYYYAIVECADIGTASQLYNECNDMEFAHSASLFDLRFVPEEQDFSGRQVREEASEMPAGYTAPQVPAAAMLHTNPKLTWDAEDDSRKKMLLQRVSKDKLRDDDFKAYLGSESEEEEFEQEKVSGAEKYKQLLSGGPSVSAGAKDWKPPAPEDTDEEESSEDEKQLGVSKDAGMEMQVTFGGGLDDLSHKLRLKQEEKANKKSDTVWEAYLRRKREKKQQMKRKRGQDSDDDVFSETEEAEAQDPFFKQDDTAFDDPFFQQTADAGAEDSDALEEPVQKKKKGVTDGAKRRAEKKQEAEAERQRKAQLEMLLLDESALQHPARPGPKQNAGDEEPDRKGKLSKKARIAAKKAEKRAKRQNDSDNEDAAANTGSFKINTEDKRFAALFEDANFALDPTDPRFSTSEANSKILKENATRRSKQPAKRTNTDLKDATLNSKPSQPTAQGEGTAEKPASLQLLVASLKRKGLSSSKRDGKRQSSKK